MEVEEIKALVRRFNDETWNKGNIAFADEFLAPNYVGWDMATGQKIGLEDLKQGIMQIRAGMPGLQIAIEAILVEGNRAVYRWKANGTDQQGKSQNVVGFSMYTFVDGKVAEDYFLTAFVNTEQTTP